MIQALEERYMYQRRDSGPAALSGSYSQLLTGHNSNSMVLVPCKGQPDPQPEGLEVAMHRGSGGYDPMEQPQRTSTGSAAPEPYQILMPVQMADGQMTALPPDQAQVGTVFCGAVAVHAWHMGCDTEPKQRSMLIYGLQLLSNSFIFFLVSNLLHEHG